jgi:hypothetical protein
MRQGAGPGVVVLRVEIRLQSFQNLDISNPPPREVLNERLRVLISGMRQIYARHASARTDKIPFGHRALLASSRDWSKQEQREIIDFMCAHGLGPSPSFARLTFCTISQYRFCSTLSIL